MAIPLIVGAFSGQLAAQEAGTPAADPPQVTMDGVPVSSSMPGIINMILVKVNGTPILLSDLESEVAERLPLVQQQIPQSELEAQMPLIRREVLRGLIDEQMMLQRADRLGIVADANQVDSQIERLREQNGFTTDAQLEEALAGMGMTLAEMRERMRSTLRQQRLVFEEVQRGIFVSEAEINSFYDENPDQFAAPDQVRLEQLVFLIQAGNEATVGQQAASAAAALRAGGSLEEVAAQFPGSVPFAEDPSFVALVDLNDALAAAVPDMPEGVYSDPVRSQFGYHVVRVAERQEQQRANLADVREQIKNRLTTQKSQDRLEQYVGQLRDRTTLEILDAQYADIEEAWKADPEEATTASR
jgi:parvulin-like peptidyl-prolyl isomerase